MRKVALLGLVALVAVAAACGKPKDRSGARLELADARIVVEQADGQLHVLALAANGAVTFDNQPVIEIQSHGHIIVDGKQLARVERDGRISVNKMMTTAAVKDDATLVLAQVEELTLAPDGTASGPLFETMDHPRVKFEGAKVRYEGPPQARRAAMVGLAAFLTDLPGAVRREVDAHGRL